MANGQGQGKDRSQQGGKGLDKEYELTGTDPVTGQPLPPRTATQRQFRDEKLGQKGYQKPADLDETAVEGDEPAAGDSGT